MNEWKIPRGVTIQGSFLEGQPWVYRHAFNERCFLNTHVITDMIVALVFNHLIMERKRFIPDHYVKYQSWPLFSIFDRYLTFKCQQLLKIINWQENAV